MKKINFSISAVLAGQKSNTANAEPRLIANSTPGKFVLTSAVTKVMGLEPGDNVAFYNNLPAVQEAIAQKSDEILAWAEENGIDLETRDGQEAAVAALTQWYIGKGVAMVDKTGAPVMINVRFTDKDKQAYIDANAADFLADENTRAALIERVGNPDATDEELIAAITIDDVTVPQEQKYSGSKTATTGLASGVGCQLNFTDSNVWGQLKEGLEDKSSKNRIFDVVLKETTFNEGTEDEETYAPIETKVSNGKDEVSVIAYPLVYNSDAELIVREKKENDNANTEE